MTPNFKQFFEAERQRLIFAKPVFADSFQIHSADLADEADMLSSELDASMQMRLRSREALYLKKVNEALERLKDGTFGECEDCGDQIENKRLQARPTTTQCMDCKETAERSEKIHIGGHRHKSLGMKLKLA